MKKDLIAVALSLLLTMPVFAGQVMGPTQRAATPVQDQMISRVIEYRSRELNTIHTRKGYATLVMLPDEEDIVEVTAGDSAFWVIDASRNFVHLKPAKDGAQSNLNIISKRGNVYTFLLAEGPAGAPIDVRVVVELKERTMRVKAGMEPEEVARPDPTRDTELRTAKDDGVQWKTKAEAASAELEQTRKALAEYADHLGFYDHNDVKTQRQPFFIEAAFTDGRATYIRILPFAVAKQLPLSFFDVGTGKMVPAELHANTYVIHKVLIRFYVAQAQTASGGHKEVFTLLPEY